ncbi:MAG: DUF3347 domain-containing protein [Chitinophagaceae bacterium]|nr:DUF3347 domain-containing protein [Chitinophagaceae bacterium]
MKKLFLLLLVAIAAFAAYWFFFRSKSGGDRGPKQAALTVKKHSLKFNESVATVMLAYFEMKNAFVDADTAKVKASCQKFIQLLDSIPVDELKADTATILEIAQSNIVDAKANAQSLLTQTDITEMRHDFSTVSEILYPSFFQSINYEGANMYWQNCPMAFGEDKGANWISSTQEVINPYLGKNHPVHKDKMLHCGEIKDTIKTK